MFAQIAGITLPMMLLSVGARLDVAQIGDARVGMTGAVLADRFRVEPGKVASMVIVGHVTGLAFVPLGTWLAFP